MPMNFLHAPPTKHLRGNRGKFLVSVQIKCTWRVRLIGINAYMISCAPINLYL